MVYYSAWGLGILGLLVGTFWVLLYVGGSWGGVEWNGWLELIFEALLRFIEASVFKLNFITAE